MRSVGIDIGSYTIKVAEVEDVSSGFVLRDFAQLHLGHDAAQDKKIQLVESLTRVARHYQGSYVQCVVGVPQHKVSVHPKVFPFKERFQIAKSLPFQLSESVPFDPNQAKFEPRYLATCGHKTDVLATITPNETIQETLDLMADANLEVDILAPAGVVLGNLFSDWFASPPELPESLFFSQMEELLEENEKSKPGVALKEPDSPARTAHVFLDIGHLFTTLSLFIGPHIIFSRALFFGGMNVVRAIAAHYKVPEVEAINYLKERSFLLLTEKGANKEQIFFSNAISEAIEPLVAMLKRTFLSLSSSENIAVSEIHLTGGVSQIANIGPYLTQKLEIPTNCMERLSFSVRGSVEPDYKSVGLSAISLAVEGLRRPRNPPLNFRKDQFAHHRGSFQIFWKNYGYALKMGAAAVVIFIIYGVFKGHFADQLRDTSRRTLRAQASSPDVNINNPTVGRVRRFVHDKRNEIQSQREIESLFYINSPLDVILEISRKFPDPLPVDIRRFSLKEETLLIEGEVTQAEQTQQIEEALKNMALDGEVESITPSITAQTGQMAFAYQLKVPRLGDTP